MTAGAADDTEATGAADDPEATREADDTEATGAVGGPDATAADDAETEPDALAAADVDWQMAPDSDAEFPDDPKRREFLRNVGDEIRARDDSSEADQVAAFVYRVSDLYDPDEDTSPAEIYLNVRHIMDIKARGGLRRDED